MSVLDLRLTRKPLHLIAEFKTRAGQNFWNNLVLTIPLSQTAKSQNCITHKSFINKISA